MRLKIKIKRHSKDLIMENPKGDFIDLATPKEVVLKKGEFKIIPLNVAMKLPKGFIAVIVARSSLYKNYSVMLANNVGIIDNTYCGNEDIWGAPLYAFEDTVIPADSRICQFEIRPSQFASTWVKLKWLFSSGLQLDYVDSLDDTCRGGFGSTGK